MKGHKCGTVEKSAEGVATRNCGDAGVYAGRKRKRESGGGLEWVKREKHGDGCGERTEMTVATVAGGCVVCSRIIRSTPGNYCPNRLLPRDWGLVSVPFERRLAR